jgi:FlaA1/EpsC-like NDP-sugar epimerase
MKDLFKNKTVLVTGGAGSIGREICRQILEQNPKILRILDNNEYFLYEAKEEFGDDKLRYLLGDLRDKDRVELAVNGCDDVIHAGAYKHVSFSEYNLPEYIETNVLGTKNVIEACLKHDCVKKMINISTDKAVSGYSSMGVTKLLGEHLISWAHTIGYQKNKKFCSVRFGNVIFSRGSFIPKAISYAKQGIKIPLTEKRMERFIMSKKDAVKLILKSYEYTGEIFILKMPCVKIKDVVEVINEIYNGAGIELIGKIQGEILYERLITKDEVNRKELKDMWIISDRFPAQKPIEYSTRNQKSMTKKEFKELLIKNTPKEFL